MAIEQRVLTAPTFHDGTLWPAGAMIAIDTDALGEIREPDTLYPGDPGNTANLAPVGALPTAEGPMSTTGEVLPGMTSDERAEVADLKAQIASLTNLVAKLAGSDGDAGVVEEEGSTSALGGDGFNAEAVIAGTVPEVTARLAGLSKDQLEAVKKAEADREQPRVGVTSAIDEALAASA